MNKTDNTGNKGGNTQQPGQVEKRVIHESPTRPSEKSIKSNPGSNPPSPKK